jgi:hypothetical protein
MLRDIDRYLESSYQRRMELHERYELWLEICQDRLLEEFLTRHSEMNQDMETWDERDLDDWANFVTTAWEEEKNSRFNRFTADI